MNLDGKWLRRPNVALCALALAFANVAGFAGCGDDTSSSTSDDDGTTSSGDGGSTTSSNSGGSSTNNGGAGNTGNEGGMSSSSGGNGGSGNTGGSPECDVAADCNDNDACTVDLCNGGTCEHQAVDPDDNNACTTDSCDPATGVINTPVDVDDQDACTMDSCDPMTGVSNVPIDPSDNNACTTDTCDPATGPVHTPIDRNDMNACTFDSCDPAIGPVNQNEIVFFSEDFSDNSAGWTLGTEWQIGPAVASNNAYAGAEDPGQDHTQAGDNGVAGAVIGGPVAPMAHGFYYLESPPIDTTTGPLGSNVELRLWRWLNADYHPFMHSTIEVYNGSSWVVVWNTGDQPTGHFLFDSNIPGYGNGWFPMSFDVTAHSNASFRVRFGYDTQGGVLPVGGWTVDDVSVVSVPYATDADQCTVASCDPASGASFAPLAIQDDGVACTSETCSTVDGVRHAPNNAACDDGNACTNDSCDVAQGCVSTPVNVDDGNACTTDACDPATGQITHTPIVCNDNNACTSDSCNAQTGCVYNPINCNDNNACTTDTCNPQYGCFHQYLSTANCSCSASECGQSGGSCYCDSDCQMFDDCCGNVGSVCGFWDGPSTCDPWECGGQGGPSCYCDLLCVQLNDCCAGGPCGP